MFLYFFDKYKKEKITSLELLINALNMYVDENNLSKVFCKEDIQKGNNNKPYIKDSNIKYNISHSDNVWICAIDIVDIGIDIEKIREKNYLKISKRYFTLDETKYIEEKGNRSFLKIWTIKEAYTKLLGENIFNKVSDINVVKEGNIVKMINGIFVKEVSVLEGFESAIATYEEDIDICLRMIK
ncbi:MAG: 4'-phosphopantetheinyl transferase family protein [Lachnospirales bacterium]